jgi:hypothetical protein
MQGGECAAIRDNTSAPRAARDIFRPGATVGLLHEHPLRLRHAHSMSLDDPTSRAAGLAERLVDEVARPDQDWARIRALALELADLARKAARVAEDDQESEQ